MDPRLPETLGKAPEQFVRFLIFLCNHLKHLNKVYVAHAKRMSQFIKKILLVCSNILKDPIGVLLFLCYYFNKATKRLIRLQKINLR